MANPATMREVLSDGIAVQSLIPAAQPGDVFPAGTILLWGAAAAPAGWMICDGTAISRAGFPTLFANYGTVWGAGDGVNTFNIPDLRGRTPVGVSGSHALAATGGAETHAITVPELPSHNHGGATGTQSANHTHSHGGNFALPDAVGGVNSGKFWGTAGTAVWEGGFTTGNESATHTHAVSAQGGDVAMSLMQPFANVNFIIRVY